MYGFRKNTIVVIRYQSAVIRLITGIEMKILLEPSNHTAQPLFSVKCHIIIIYHNLFQKIIYSIYQRCSKKVIILFNAIV